MKEKKPYQGCKQPNTPHQNRRFVCLEPPKNSPLNSLEQGILQSVSDGKPTDVIAHLACLSAPYIRKIKWRAVRKLGAHSVEGAIKVAVKRSYIV